MKGAYTGADRDRQGVFEYADKGTLFLDELGDLPLAMQAKLLRVLENGELVRVGSHDSRKVAVRFVSATNKDLEKATKDGSFRQDLYFRIKGSHIHLPPLRERREDIPRIIRHAASKFASELGRNAPAFSDAAVLRLTAYSWPGNVRQLLNVVQNIVVMAAGETEGKDVSVDVRHVPAEVQSEAEGDGELTGTGAGGSLAGPSLEALEKRAIRETLKLTGGNREQTAKLLGIGERTLYRKRKDYGLR